MSLAFPDFDEEWSEYNMSHVHIMVSHLASSDVFAISTWTPSISDMSPKKMLFFANFYLSWLSIKTMFLLGAEILNEKIQHFEVTEQVQLIAPAKTPQKKRIVCNP